MNEIRSFRELSEVEQPNAGGKGGTLARLYQAGYPVPDGFVILPMAFVDDELKAEAWEQVQAYLAHIRKADEKIAFAVRSSALSEDSDIASFAGEFETVLDVHSDEMIRVAIHTVRHSRHSERVRAYSDAKGMDTTHDMAVVVQQLIRADISGVLFTAEPVSGSRAEMLGNFVYGFGEELVSGEAEPYTFNLKRPRGRYNGPQELKPFARKLYQLACQLDGDFGCPQDIEWSIADGKLYLLQSRPITTLVEQFPISYKWNAASTEDYLWTNLIVAEGFPTTTTPSTWSVWQDFFSMLSMGDFPTIERIAGRPYLNYSLMYSFLSKILRKHERVVSMVKDSIGIPPSSVGIPPFPVSWRTILFQVLPKEVKNQLRKGRLRKIAPEYLAMVRERCQELKTRIEGTSEDELIALWTEEIRPLWIEIHPLQDKMNEELNQLTQKLKNDLIKVLGEKEVNVLMTTISGAGELASLGPLVGLSKLRSGELSREEYFLHYGHRGLHENELAEPRPHEDPIWLDKQMEVYARSPVEVTELLKKRDAEFNAVQQEVRSQLSVKEAEGVTRRIAAIVETNALRETTRSELTRIVDVIRSFFLRAGELSGLGDDVFFLTVDELITVLSGNTASIAHIPTRQQAYEIYKALPPLPVWILGPFDPIQWAADPNRRKDVFNAYESEPFIVPIADKVIHGKPGSAGRVEGIVRRIDNPDEGDRFQSGEILVTSTTNVGWTPLFPRGAAVVTDIGGSLSHAAIVARELGIPAVVGCGDATARLQTGDRVRVDGGAGIVEIIEKVGDE
jgi:phosphohistidine swiveling domain-containing protein